MWRGLTAPVVALATCPILAAHPGWLRRWSPMGRPAPSAALPALSRGSRCRTPRGPSAADLKGQPCTDFDLPVIKGNRVSKAGSRARWCCSDFWGELVRPLPQAQHPCSRPCTGSTPRAG